MPGICVVVGSESQINDAVVLEQSWRLIFVKRVERHAASGRSGARPRHACLNYNRTSKLLQTRGDVEGVQALHIVTTFQGRSNYVDCSAGLINDRRTRDSNLDKNVTASSDVGAGNRGGAGVEETCMPQGAGR